MSVFHKYLQKKKKVSTTNKRRIQFSLNSDFENYIKKIYYELETDRAVMFGRNEDDKILFIPKSVTKGGWKKDTIHPQNVRIKFGIKLYWKLRIFE